MTPEEIRTVRSRLDLSQVQLAKLLGVHPVTVSKWERGVLTPTPHQIALLQSFAKASQEEEKIGDEVESTLVTAGVAVALYVLLRAAFNDD